MNISKFFKSISLVPISLLSVSPICSCSNIIEYFAVAKSSIYVGETLSENDITVLHHGKVVEYDETGKNGWKIDDSKYNIGYCFNKNDIGDHTIQLSYDNHKIYTTLVVTTPKAVTAKFDLTSYQSKFYKTPKIAEKIYIVHLPNEEVYRTYKSQWFILLQSLEGILAQTEARLFINYDSKLRNTWILEAQKECGFITQNITPIQALEIFRDEIQDSKLVIYQNNDMSINNATVVSACDHYLMCDKNSAFLDIIKKLGFSVGFDATTLTTQECFHKYKSELSNKLLINQNPSNLHLRDYAIASKSFTTYLDFLFNDPNFQQEVLAWIDTDSVVLGWTNNELQMVDLLSQYSKVIIPSDHCANLSLYSAYKLKENSYQVHKEKIVPKVGEHYVAIVMSDGDNIQWLQGDWFTKDWFCNSHRGQWPMNWTLNPSIIDLNPQISERINSIKTYNDYFVCSGSGYGYINYSKYPNRTSYSKITAEYMKNNDMTIAYYLDPYEKKPQNFKEAFDQEQIHGGVWAYGEQYAAGKGGVYWLNDKPLVCCRETLWLVNYVSKKYDSNAPENMAARINKYSTNPYSISGYTIINGHSWSYGKMDEVKKLVDNLDSHVKIITLEQMIDMITQYVPHIDVEHA